MDSSVKQIKVTVEYIYEDDSVLDKIIYDMNYVQIEHKDFCNNGINEIKNASCGNINITGGVKNINKLMGKKGETEVTEEEWWIEK